MLIAFYIVYNFNLLDIVVVLKARVIMKRITEMQKIYDSLIQVANAISSVLNVDVMIIDDLFNRIVSTGKSAFYTIPVVDEESAFAYALRHGKSFVIDDPRTHEVCISCKNKDSCVEYAEVCCPIFLNGKPIGVIALIAFDEERKAKLLSNQDNILSFLNRMAELIAAKIVETRKTNQITRMAEEMTVLFDSIDRGVISIDENGKILRFNDKANKLFDISHEKRCQIKEVIGDEGIERLRENKRVKNVSLTFGENIRAMYSARPFHVNDQAAGYVLLFDEVEGVIESYKQIVSSTAETEFADIVGQSKRLIDVKSAAHKASDSSSTILIQGESGTGKELFARAIHQSSKRKNESFVPINCAAIPEQLLESELFGYEDGAFTGARKGGRMGKFELANGGTLFLDEIGDMSLHLQSKLLRVLQDGIVDRIGGKKPVSVDVRIIAATNQDLDQKVKDNEFREDLYYRLNVIPIKIPTLRSRIEDIEILADYFLKLYVAKMNREIFGFEFGVLQKLRRYNWPGNIRELENAIEYAVNMTHGKWIVVDDLPERIRRVTERKTLNHEVITSISVLEKREIEKAITMYGKNQKGIELASAALGISRASIYRKLKEQSQSEKNLKMRRV